MKERFIPLLSSSTQSASQAATSEEGGRPQSEIGDLTDSGEASRETEDGDNNEE